ncbi:HAUS augmin-like complex subunit 4-domain-containing protein [Umbelopsis sp. PMI_123]|nr:HAUS augmin-like complex subunit 4-domain-containing protein [Umbelopsis sp. PMI_123]
MSETSVACSPTEFLNQLEEFLFLQESDKNLSSSRASYYEDQVLVTEALQYLLGKGDDKRNTLYPVTNVDLADIRDDGFHKRLPSEVMGEIDYQIQKKAETIVEMILVGNFRQDDEDWDMDIINESLFDKLDRVEETLRLQQKGLAKLKHQIPRMRQDLMNDYADSFEAIYKTMNVMIELLTDVILNKELHRFSVFEKYMESLTKSLTLKLNVLDATIHLNTYDQDTVRALHVIRSSLETQYNEMRTKIEEVETKMEAYNSQGPDFKEIANAYAKVISKIKDTKEHIARINSPY